MYNNAIPALTDAISAIRSDTFGSGVYGRLKEAARIAAALPAAVPVQLADAELKIYEDTDCMLDKLSKLINILYNKENPVCVMSPDLFLAHTGYERAAKQLPSAVYTTSRGIRADGLDSKAFSVIFIQADRNMPSDLILSSPAILLLCPARFHSAQLAWTCRHIRADSKIMLLDADHAGDFASAVRENDKKALEFMMARWELEKDEKAKNAQLEDILQFFEAMVWGVESDGTGA